MRDTVRLFGLILDHGAVDRVAEVALEDSHGFLLGVTVGTSGSEEFLSALVYSELGNGHDMDDRVHAAVPAAVEAMSRRFTASFARRGWDRCGAVEAGEAGFGETARVTGLDDELGGVLVRDAAQLGQCRVELLEESRDLAGHDALSLIERQDRDAVLVEHCQPQPGELVDVLAALDGAQRTQAGPNRLGVGKLVSERLGKRSEQRFRLTEELLAHLEQRSAGPVPEPELLEERVGSDVAGGSLEGRGETILSQGLAGDALGVQDIGLALEASSAALGGAGRADVAHVVVAFAQGRSRCDDRTRWRLRCPTEALDRTPSPRPQGRGVRRRRP